MALVDDKFATTTGFVKHVGSPGTGYISSMAALHTVLSIADDDHPLALSDIEFGSNAQKDKPDWPSAARGDNNPTIAETRQQGECMVLQ